MRVRVGLLVATAALTVSACSSSGGKSSAGWFEVRPLIMPGQHATEVRADPFASLHVPATENAYSRLSSTERKALQAALRGVDCAHPPAIPGASVRVACDAVSDVFLLGAPIFTGNDVTKAAPVPASDSDPQWSLQLSLSSTAADNLNRWTSRHNVHSASGVFEDVQRSSKVPCSAFARTQCSDFLAYISHDTVLTVPVTFEPVESVVMVLGDFNETSASRLARQING